MHIAQRIKDLRLEKRLSQVDFAKQLGISQAAVSHYEKGERTPDSAFMHKVCSKFNLNINWLLTGEGERYNSVLLQEELSPQLVSIPVSCPIAAGFPLSAIEDEPIEILHIPASLLHLPPPYFAFKVEGESMSPYIMDGDIVVLSRDWREVKLNNRICGFRTLDGITLKKLVLQPRQKTAWLMPLNHTYEPTPYNKDTEELNLFGVLVLSIRKYT